MKTFEYIPKPKGPIAWNESLSAWTIWRHSEVVAILKNPHFSASAGYIDHQSQQLPTINKDSSTVHRPVISGIKNQLDWASKQIEQVAAVACKKLKGQVVFDLQQDLILPCCHQLSMLLTGTSVDEKQAQVLLNHAQTVFLMSNKNNRTEAEKATIELSKHFLKLIEERSLSPKDDFVSIFAKSNQPHYALLSPVIQMFVGLSTSMPLLLGNVLLSLLSCPKQNKGYLQQPHQAVGELLRYAGPAQLVYRFTLKDTLIGKHLFKRGDRLALLLTHANKDESIFENPKELNFGRDAVAHLSFGKGAHACLGAPIIREVVAILPHTILSCFPDLKPDIATVCWGGSRTIQGVKVLRVYN